MRLLTPILLLSCFLFACVEGQQSNQQQGEDTPKTDVPSEEKVRQDTTPKVTGIGGIFFGTADPEAMRNWYGDNLGLAIDDYGSPFEFRNANNPDEVNYLRWGPFEAGSNYFDPSEKEFMINYRVQNIEGLVRNLRASGVNVLDSIQSFDYGKFVHIMDPDGNKIELWEPIDSFFYDSGIETTK
ncbi:MAG: VOC family protein [Bacteroidetes bacterium]|nr:VOC family protein [Bacteroidota bacterium]